MGPQSRPGRSGVVRKREIGHEEAHADRERQQRKKDERRLNEFRSLHDAGKYLPVSRKPSSFRID
jgi:hypothetical protein